jgi:hypothetical protein
MEKQTVYLPTGEDTQFAVTQYNNPLYETVEKSEGFFFAEDELRDLLKDVCGGYYGFREAYIDSLFTQKHAKPEYYNTKFHHPKPVDLSILNKYPTYDEYKKWLMENYMYLPFFIRTWYDPEKIEPQGYTVEKATQDGHSITVFGQEGEQKYTSLQSCQAFIESIGIKY